jgi:hypothetical protein
MQSMPSDSAMKDRADVDGDGIPFTQNDLNLLSQYINKNISYLPGHWNKLKTRKEREDWVKKMLVIDKTDTIQDPNWVCVQYSERLHYNFFGLEQDSTEFKIKSRFNIPVYSVTVIDTLAKIGHAFNCVLTGDNVLDAKQYLFIEPQNDSFSQVEPDSLHRDMLLYGKNGGFIANDFFLGIEQYIFLKNKYPPLSGMLGYESSIIGFYVDEITRAIEITELHPQVKLTRDNPTGIVISEGKNIIIPKIYYLGQSYPNPANPRTTISYELPKPAKVNLSVYNSLGQRLETLVDGLQASGLHSIKLDVSNYASGIYFYILKTPEFTEAKRMVVVK